ncbi:MAG: response regulator [Candidatus Omnitrophota bacterium]|jgi:DNA-binding response OmpR family regulator|nr:MAG: response regulator [Candidatus Omnitrophota bacterium]
MKKLFIVDDEAEVTEVLKSHFQRRGLEVYSCSSGEEAVKLLLEKQPDLALLDYKLEGPMTGLDVLKKIRESGSTVKVIISTGALEDKVKEEAITMGVETFLNKPLTMSTLDEVVENNLKD